MSNPRVSTRIHQMKPTSGLAGLHPSRTHRRSKLQHQRSPPLLAIRVRRVPYKCPVVVFPIACRKPACTVVSRCTIRSGSTYIFSCKISTPGLCDPGSFHLPNSTVPSRTLRFGTVRALVLAQAFAWLPPKNWLRFHLPFTHPFFCPSLFALRRVRTAVAFVVHVACIFRRGTATVGMGLFRLSNPRSMKERGRR